MLIYLKEYFLTLSLVFMYGLVGGFSLIPFRKEIRYFILAAPLAGVLLLQMITYLFYFWLKISILNSATIAIFLCITSSLLSLIYFKPKINRSDLIFSICIALTITALTTYFVNYSSILINGTSFLFREGSDQLGYSMFSDWFRNHLILNLPAANPLTPLSSWPNFVSTDARYGSHFTLAIIAILLKQSSMFAFDNACAIVLITSYLGVSAVYSRSPKTLVLLLTSLFICFWFILSRTGYFGKIMGFPSILYVVGLFFIQQRNFHQSNKYQMLCTLIFVLAAAIIYPGFVLSYVVMFVGSSLLFFKILYAIGNFNNENLTNIRDTATELLLFILIGFSVAGVFEHPSGFVFSTYQLTWFQILLSELEIHPLAYDVIFPWFTPFVEALFLIFTIFLMCITLTIAIFKKNVIASSLIGSALLLIIIPYILSENWVCYELSGVLFGLSMFGCAYLIDDLKLIQQTFNIKFITYSLFFIMLSAISLRVPAFIEATNRYVYRGVPEYMRYSKREFNKLAQLIKNNSVIVDVPNVMFALPILVEFGRRDMNLQWTPDSWKAIVGYRSWDPPKLTPTSLVLGLKQNALYVLNLKQHIPENCNMIGESRQYMLFDCKNLNLNAPPFTYQPIPT